MKALTQHSASKYMH